MKRLVLFLSLLTFSPYVLALTCEMPEVGNLSDLQKILDPEEKKIEVSDDNCSAHLICHTFITLAIPFEALDQYGRNIKEEKDPAAPDYANNRELRCERAVSWVQKADIVLQDFGTGDCGMTDEEKAAIHFYAASGFRCLNEYLRSGYKNPIMDKFVKTLDSALAKLPSYQGIVVRGTSLPSHIMDLHQPGQKVLYDSFTSTSTDSGFSGADTFLILSKTGKPIMGLSNYDNEAEILFKSRTTFKILARHDEDGDRRYFMREVEPNETKEMELASDKAAMEELKKFKQINEAPRDINASIPRADMWRCEREKTPPQTIKQNNIPRIRVPAGMISGASP